MLEVGTKAPDFELSDQNGEVHKLSDYLGKKVILYFYPKDNTAGCTKQACGFSERYPQFRSLPVWKKSASTLVRTMKNTSVQFPQKMQRNTWMTISSHQVPCFRNLKPESTSLKTAMAEELLSPIFLMQKTDILKRQVPSSNKTIYPVSSTAAY